MNTDSCIKIIMDKLETEITPLNDRVDLLTGYNQNVPHITKYMGSKRSILDFVISNINDVYTGGRVCDLFAGTSILSGALGKIIPIHSNDIQEYSAILSKTYLSSYSWDEYSTELLEDIINRAEEYVENFKTFYPQLSFTYSVDMTIEQFVALEAQQQMLLNYNFDDTEFHLFVKCYSGTYWSFEQCLWIDAIRRVADEYIESPVYYVILSSLIYGMSYCSQSTGHYAQYRDAKNESSKKDILIYRLRSIVPYFETKFKQLKEYLSTNGFEHYVTSLDYRECLDIIEPGTLVYADPPYGFVHYSRFYHALETLVKYDYPDVNHKGRYRTDRHQSPFGRGTEVKEAFKSLFLKIREKHSDLILSYSNTGMIKLDEIIQIAQEAMGEIYEVSYKEADHIHSTMGRSDDKSKDVTEYLIIAKRK